jgi:hypothetical protein
MQQFLDHFAATIGKDEHAVMVLDQAGWHDSRALCVPANLTLVPLPPYSPELNPVAVAMSGVVSGSNQPPEAATIAQFENAVVEIDMTAPRRFCAVEQCLPSLMVRNRRSRREARLYTSCVLGSR